MTSKSKEWVKLTCFTISDLRGDFSLLQGIMEDVLHLAKWNHQEQTWQWVSEDLLNPEWGPQLALVLVVMGNFTWPYSFPCVQPEDIKILRKPHQKTQKIVMDDTNVLLEQTLVIHAISELIKTAPTGVMILPLLGPHEWALLKHRYEMNSSWQDFIGQTLIPFCTQNIYAVAQVGPFLFSRGGLRQSWFVDMFHLDIESQRKQRKQQILRILNSHILKPYILDTVFHTRYKILTHTNRQLRQWFLNGASFTNPKNELVQLFSRSDSPVFNTSFSTFANMQEYRTTEKTFWRRILNLSFDPVMVVANTNVHEMKHQMDQIYLSNVNYHPAFWVDEPDVVFVQRGMSFSDCKNTHTGKGPQVTGLEATFSGSGRFQNKPESELLFVELAWLGLPKTK